MNGEETPGSVPARRSKKDASPAFLDVVKNAKQSYMKKSSFRTLALKKADKESELSICFLDEDAMLSVTNKKAISPANSSKQASAISVHKRASMLDNPMFKKVNIESLQKKMARNPEKIQIVTKFEHKKGGIRFDKSFIKSPNKLGKKQRAIREKKTEEEQESEASKQESFLGVENAVQNKPFRFLLPESAVCSRKNSDEEILAREEEEVKVQEVPRCDILISEFK